MENASKSWYVLYVRSNTEKRVIHYLKEAASRRAQGYFFEPFCPQSEVYYRSAKNKPGGVAYKVRPLFPGYVFIETDMAQANFVREFSAAIYDSPDIIRLLRYGSDGGYAMASEERARFDYLLRGRRCLERSIGYIEGDRVRITSGPLVGLEGSITRINRHNRVASIRIELYGNVIEAALALEIVEKS